MKLCVSSHMIGTIGSVEEFREMLAFNRQAGFEEIDFAFDTPMMLRAGWKEDFRAKLALAKEAGVPFRYAHLPFDYPRPGGGYDWDDFMRASRRAMDLAAEAGADCAAIHPRTWLTRDYDADREHAAALEFLEPYCEYAAKAGLQLGIENMRGGGRSADPGLKRYATETDDLIRLADELSAGVCWDTGHANISAQPQDASLIKVGGRLRMVHVNDNFAEDDVHIAPFIGNVNWDAVAAGLKAAGYRGSMNLEVTSRNRPKEIRLDYALYMAASARKLVKMMM